MLYTSFRATVMAAAILGLLHMITEGSFIYMFFPIAIIIWAVYTFFDENDREYLRRNGINPEAISWSFNDYSDYGYVPQNTYYGYREYSNPVYKVLKDKCKRNFKITISKENDTEQL